MAEAIDLDLTLLPPQERFGFWHDNGSRVYRPNQLWRDGETDLYVRARMVPLGSVVLGRMTSSVQHYERTELMLKRDQVDHFHLILLEKGAMDWNAEQQSYRLASGDLLLVDASQVACSSWSEHRIIFANLPRELLAPLSAGQRSVREGLLKAAHPYARLLAQHLKTLWASQAAGLDGSGAGLGVGLSALVRTYFQDHAALPMADGGVEEKRLLLASMQDWIRGQLHRPDLDAQLIGRFFHLSRSSVYELFRPLGGVSSYVQALRLEKARELLCSSQASRMAIGSLAMQLGFSSVSVFSRAFRGQWGVSPKQMRAETMAALRLESSGGGDAARRRDADALREQLRRECTRYYATFRQG